MRSTSRSSWKHRNAAPSFQRCTFARSKTSLVSLKSLMRSSKYLLLRRAMSSVQNAPGDCKTATNCYSLRAAKPNFQKEEVHAQSKANLLQYSTQRASNGTGQSEV